MEKNEAIERTLLMVKKSGITPVSSTKLVEKEMIQPNYHDIHNWLPPLQTNQFVLLVDNAIFCIAEPTWWDAQRIEYDAFRQEGEEVYFVSEYEKRELLRHCLVWVADIDTKQIIKENILEQIHSAPIEKLWNSLYSKLKIDSVEANNLYEAAKVYFSNSQKMVPMHPIIIEVDMMMKFGSLTRQEIRNISMTDMERIKIVLMARSEIMNLTGTMDITNKQEKTQDDNLLEQYQKHPALFPPGVNPLSSTHYIGVAKQP